MTLSADLVNAWRTLARRPGFALTVVLTLALGVGATAAMSSIVKGVLLAPTTLPGGERVVVVHRIGDEEADVSQPDIVDLRSAKGLEAVGILWPGFSFDLLAGEEPERVVGGLVDPGYFASTGVQPLLGRGFTSAEEGAAAVSVAVLAEPYWRSRFAADPDVVGRTIELSGVATTVIGVVPTSTDVLGLGIQVWAPLAPFAPWAFGTRGSNNFEAIARLREGVTLEQANAELGAITTALQAAHPRSNGGKVLMGTPLVEFLTREAGPRLALLAGAVVLLMLVATVNVAGLLLVRAAGREREMAVRNALGAGQGRILRQLLAEGVLLGLGAALLGCLIALAGFSLLRAAAGEVLPRAELIVLDLPVIAVSLAVAITAGILASLAPVWRLRRATATLRGARALGGSDGRVLGPLVAIELALAVLLLIGATLMLRSLWNLTRVPLGFTPEPVLTAELVLPDSRYAAPAQQTPAIDAIVRELAATPGVRHAGFVVGLPIEGSSIGHRAVLDGIPVEEGQPIGVRVRPVHGAYFETMDITAQRGRLFDARDTAGAERVAIVNQRFVDMRLGGRDPIGQRVAWNPGDVTPVEEGPRWMTIVGVVEDVKSQGLRNADSPAVYFPFVQRAQNWFRFGELVIAVDGEPGTYARAMQQAVWRVDPKVPLEDVSPMSRLVERALGPNRFIADLVVLFGAVAVLLALQGLFGVIAYAVEQRRAEVGLRLALGASPARVTRMVLGQGLRYSLAGVLVGMMGAVLLGRFLESQLFGLTARDPLSYSLVAATLLAAAALATWLPARRAAATDPMTVLRSE